MRAGTLFGLFLVAGTGAAGYIALSPSSSEPGREKETSPVLVEASPVERGKISLVRTYGGTVEAPHRFLVAPQMSGRIESLPVDIGDRVERGQVVARLFDRELKQLVAEARAELRVASAQAQEAESRAEIAARELKRLQTLRGRGVVSPSQLDSARADTIAAEAATEVANAEVARARAALDGARIRLGYAEVAATWNQPPTARVVGARFVDEGTMVEAQTPILSVVDLDPLRVVLFVPEKDYRFLRSQLPAQLRTDAYPGQAFSAVVARFAPVFQPDSRQARVELSVPNPDGLLKPGMFVRASLTLEVIDDAIIVPQTALTHRAGQVGVFGVSADGSTVRFQTVRPGIEEGPRVQILGSIRSGRVVTLGHQLLDDGSRVTVLEGEPDDDRSHPPHREPLGEE